MSSSTYYLAHLVCRLCLHAGLDVLAGLVGAGLALVPVVYTAQLPRVLLALLVDDGMAGLLGVEIALLLVGGVAPLAGHLGAVVRIAGGAFCLLEDKLNIDTLY